MKPKKKINLVDINEDDSDVEFIIDKNLVRQKIQNDSKPKLNNYVENISDIEIHN